MECTICGTPLTGDLDTYGDVRLPMCQNCYLVDAPPMRPHGMHIASARRRAGYSLQMASYGMDLSQYYLAELERNGIQPHTSDEIVYKLSNTYKVSEDYIRDGKPRTMFDELAKFHDSPAFVLQAIVNKWKLEGTAT